MFKYQTIRLPISLALTLAVLLPAVVINAVNAVIGIQSAVNQSQNQLETVSALKQSQIDFWVDETLSDLNTTAVDPDFLLRTRQALPDSDFPTLRDRAQQEVRSALGAARRVSATFEDLFLVTPTGEIVVTTALDPPPNFNLDSPEGSVVLPPIYDAALDETIITLFVPIIDNEQVIALLGGVSITDPLNAIMSDDVGLGTTGNTYLVNEAGLLLTPSRIGDYEIGDELSAALTDRTLTNTRYNTYHGAEVIGVASALSVPGVILRAEQNTAEVLQPTYTTLFINGVTAILAVVLFVVGGIYSVTSNIVRPLEQLSETAQRIAQGDLSLRATIRHNDEIGQLAGAFNTMTTSLSETIAERDENLKTIQQNNRELRVATNKAREAARVKGEFLSTMSHELRTPLNAIIGFSDMLLMGMSGELNEKQTHKVKRLQDNGKRLLELVNDSLDLTRIESGRVDLQIAPFVVSDLTNRMYDQMQVLAEQKDLLLDVWTDPNLPDTLIGDWQRIEQVIVNLLSNAFKFTDKGSVKLSLRHQDADHWCLAVEDTGMGIPPHAKDLIFEEFRQLDGSTRRVHKGTGLGLAITRNLVRIMGGTIRVDSVLNEGSAFTVTLPYLTEDDVTPDEESLQETV